MNFARFEREISNLRNLFGKKGFYKEPNKHEIDVFGKFLNFHSEVEIITSRLEKEIADFNSYQKYVIKCVRKNRKPNKIKIKEFGIAFAKIILDLSDFYIYTRMFLDTLNVCIKLSFRSAGNKKWIVMKNSIKGVLNEKKLRTYKKEIDSHFFEGLEKKVSWIRDFKNVRDELLHHFSHFVFTSTREGDLGYGIVKGTETWGTDTVTSILEGLQKVIDNLSDLMEYLSKNLPRIA